MLLVHILLADAQTGDSVPLQHSLLIAAVTSASFYLLAQQSYLTAPARAAILV